MKTSNYILSTDELSEYGLSGKRIIFSTRSVTSIIVDDADHHYLMNADYGNIEASLWSTLKEKEFVVPEEQDEFEHIIRINQEVKEAGNFLSVTIQPSANCQLGCHYCGQTHTKDYASDEVIDKYLDRLEYLLSLKPYDGISITWYGGEPLTGYSAIRKASGRLIAMCEQRGLSYTSNMITNGLGLKPLIFKELVEKCKVTGYQITLDGIAESHNKRRLTKSGEGTFDLILKNIVDVSGTEIYREHNCHISIRVNIDQTNYESVDPLIEMIHMCDLQEKVSMYFAPIVDFGGNDAGKAGLKKDFFAQKEIDWLLKCYEYDIPVNAMPDRSYAVCMAEKKDSEVYDAFGNIYACWEFPYSDYAEGESLIGNLFSPKETYNENATLRDWNDVLRSGTTWCKTCTHLPICGGACPKSWYEGTPACPAFKFNYQEKLILDYFMTKDRQFKVNELEKTPQLAEVY